MEIATGFVTETISILKDKSLRSRYGDRSYPANVVPFYLYGTPNSLNIDHILVRNPNIQLSAEDVQLSIVKGGSDPAGKPSYHQDNKDHNAKSTSSDHGGIPAEVLAKGAILVVEGISEVAMQPFQPTKPLGDSFASDSNFFFRPGQEFDVTVYEDQKAFNAPGPGLADVSTSKKLGQGKLKLGKARYVDSVEINKDPFERVDGVENFKAWKAKLDSIGKELE